jgi:hypothetical protein
MQPRQGWFGGLVGLGAIGCALVGILSFVLAVVSAVSGDLLAAGVCSTAAALAFGLLLVGVLPR